MLLFLDVISPLSEFTLIFDNKILINKKILLTKEEKLSDNIISVFQEIDREFKVLKNLKKIIITIGPGSYTNLRIGASFVAGIKYASNVKVCALSVNDLLSFLITKHKLNNSVLYLETANKQNFLCIKKNYDHHDYIKVDKENYIFDEQINTLFYNNNQLITNTKNIKHVKFSILQIVMENHSNLVFDHCLIKPIYISNNKILN